jgi:hypothetical protein
MPKNCTTYLNDLYNPRSSQGLRLATNTKLLQAMADVMLPLFDNMPRVLLVVRDDEAFHTYPQPLAVYSYPRILINPTHPSTSSFNDLKGTICHELIHAWLNWKGLDRKGEFLDEHHNEWFIKKALEINQMNVDGLKVDVEYLLTNPKAIEIYTRLGGTRTNSWAWPETSRIEREVAAVKTGLLDLFGLSKNDYFLKILIVCFLVVITSLFLSSRSRLISNTIASLVWITWTAAVLIWMGIEAWKEFTTRRASGIHIFQKRIMSAKGYKVVAALAIGLLVLYALVAVLW